MGEKQTDLELVRRVQAGDKSAFDVLVLKYQQKVINLVTRYVHDPHIAMDVAQESFIKAYRGLKNFRGDSAFYTWLYRISINTAKNYLVSKSRRMPDDDIDAQEAEQYDGGGKLREISTPEREALTEEIQITVQNAIEALPDDLRIAITLRELEGLSYEEISETMDCPIGTVRSRIFRARESIESELAPLLDKT
ncbi:MAG: RNA polymerase sigma factor RpoE [Thiotrichaceae bacterium]|nr:RNA polymerase sigma factor RpoE [Thiotrichaceae bacterium]